MYYPQSNAFECDGCPRIVPILRNSSLRETWFAMWRSGWRSWGLGQYSCPACEATIAAEAAQQRSHTNV